MSYSIIFETKFIKLSEGMTTCDYCGKTVESEQAAITGIGWVVCPTCAKVYGKLDGIVTKAEKPQLAHRGVKRLVLEFEEV